MLNNQMLLSLGDLTSVKRAYSMPLSSKCMFCNFQLLQILFHLVYMKFKLKFFTLYFFSLLNLFSSCLSKIIKNSKK